MLRQTGLGMKIFKTGNNDKQFLNCVNKEYAEYKCRISVFLLNINITSTCTPKHNCNPASMYKYKYWLIIIITDTLVAKKYIFRAALCMLRDLRQTDRQTYI